MYRQEYQYKNQNLIYSNAISVQGRELFFSFLSIYNYSIQFISTSTSNKLEDNFKIL